MRSYVLRTKLVAATLMFVLAAGGHAGAAPGLEGAWTYSECEALFVHRGKSVSFKRPVDLFAAAFIVSGNRLRTPMASCSIVGTKRVNDRHILKLSCATSVAVSDVTAILAPQSDGTLKRYSDSNDAIGTTYRRCTS
jgi:hypothetical protein